MNQTAAAAANTKAPGVQTRPQRGRRTWLRIFLGSLALWVATVLVTFATQNNNLIPTIILLGSFGSRHVRDVRIQPRHGPSQDQSHVRRWRLQRSQAARR